MIVVAVLALFLFARQRQLNLLRDQIHDALALEARQRPLLAVAGVGAEPAPSAMLDADAPPTIHRARRLGRPAILALAAAALIVVALALAFTLLRTNLIVDHHARPPAVSHHATSR